MSYTKYSVCYALRSLLTRIPRQALVRLADRRVSFSSPTAIGAHIISDYVHCTSRLVSTRLHKHCVLPLTRVPAILQSVTVALIHCQLCTHHPRNSLPSAIGSSRGRTLQRLERLHSGELALKLPSARGSIPRPNRFHMHDHPTAFNNHSNLLRGC